MRTGPDAQIDVRRGDAQFTQKIRLTSFRRNAAPVWTRRYSTSVSFGLLARSRMCLMIGATFMKLGLAPAIIRSFSFCVIRCKFGGFWKLLATESVLMMFSTSRDDVAQSWRDWPLAVAFLIAGPEQNLVLNARRAFNEDHLALFSANGGPPRRSCRAEDAINRYAQGRRFAVPWCSPPSPRGASCREDSNRPPPRLGTITFSPQTI